MATFDDFRNAIKAEGLVRRNRFTVFFPMPQPLMAGGFGFTQTGLRKILMFCSHAELPGLSVATNPIRTTGEVRNAPYDRNFNSFSLTFYVDADMNVKYFFEEWINLIQNRDNRQFAFYDDYAIPTMLIEVENIKNQKIYFVAAHDVYPKSISGVELGHDIDGVMHVTVTFEYRYWHSERMNDGEFVNLSAVALGPGDQFITIQGSALPGIGKIADIAAVRAIVQPTASILSGNVASLQASVASVQTGIGGLPAQIPTNMANTANSNLITSMLGKVTLLNNGVANIGTILQSPAGSNMSPVNLDGIYSSLNQVRALVANGSQLTGAISSFLPSSVGNIATQLNTMNGQLDLANTKLFATNTKVNDSITAASTAINQLGALTAPNRPKGS